MRLLWALSQVSEYRCRSTTVMSQVPVFGLACDVFCVLHRFSVAGRPIFEDLQRYEAPPATIPTITCDGPPHRNGITITRDGLPWADSVLPLQAVPKYDGMTWNTESATTHQSLASNCLSVTYLQYIPRSKIERGMYYNSHSHNNLAATKKPALKRGPEKHKLLWSLTS